MCNFLITKILNKHKIEESNKIQKRRGPDFEKTFEKGEWVFVHNLLSLTGEFTPQPLVSEDGNIVLVFNGQIYNYLEFGKFYSSDGYCILDLYLTQGIESLKKLNGEFAITIFDFNLNKIFMLRDTFGTKPLYYSDEGNIASYPSAVKILNSSDTIEIKKINPNTCYEFDLETFQIIKTFELLTFDLEQKKDTYDDWINAFEKAIRDRISTDKTILVCLSSGFDSGGIVCAMNKLNLKKYNICSIIGHENLDIINRRHQISKPYIEHDSTIFRLSHHERDQYFNYITQNCENFKWENPHYHVFEDPATLGLAKIYTYTKEKYNPKIILSGSGADEIMSQYNLNKKFPNDLKPIFPWDDFYGFRNEMYLMKEESIGGSFGFECRFPYLDRNVVQEFLWLSSELKNRMYKAPLNHYLQINNFPFENKKIGFDPIS